MLIVNDAFRETADKLTGQSHRAEQLEREDALQRASECCRGYASYLGGRPWREHQTTPMSAHMAGIRRHSLRPHMHRISENDRLSISLRLFSTMVANRFECAH